MKISERLFNRYPKPTATATELLARYHVDPDQPLGAGGSADVFKGLDRLTGQSVAVRVQRDQTDFDRQLVHNTLLQKKYRHEHILPIIDAGVVPEWTQAGWIFVFPLMDSSLQNWPAIRDAQLIRLIVGQLFSAVVYVHERGRTHNDIKPGNILVKKTEQTLQTALTDFELSGRLSTRRQHDDLHRVLATMYFLWERWGYALAQEQDLPTTDIHGQRRFPRLEYFDRWDFFYGQYVMDQDQLRQNKRLMAITHLDIESVHRLISRF
jgi:serine/threonine protein kinase